MGGPPRAPSRTGSFKVRPRYAGGMLERIGGVGGLVGLVALLGGIGLIAYRDPIIAAGMALVVVGLALVLRGVVQGFLGAMGMGEMF